MAIEVCFFKLLLFCIGLVVLVWRVASVTNVVMLHSGKIPLDCSKCYFFENFNYLCWIGCVGLV